MTLRRLLPSLLVAGFLAAAPTAQAADFNDGDYHAEVWFEWDTAELDVLIAPPAMAYAPFRLQALVDTVEDWAAAIADQGPAWLATGIDIRLYAPGVHTAPPSGFEAEDLEIVILLDAEPGAIGVAAQLDQCEFLPSHAHGASPWKVWLPGDCTDMGERICVINNTSWQTTQQGLFRLNGHEFGHCLGLGHVGDAGDFSANAVPSDDVMSYDDDASGCPSNLDLLGIQASFAEVLDETAPPLSYLPNGYGYVEVDPSDYEVYDCDGVTPVPFGLPDIDWFPL